MGAFFLRCPKCDSGNTEITKDQRWSTGLNDHIIHCRTCGKTVYGAAATEEANRQHAEWVKAEKEHKKKAKEAARIAAQAAEDKREREKEAARLVEQKRAVEVRKKAEAEFQRRVEKAERNLCAWATCTKGARQNRAVSRPTSKYCSRDCSNRNARARHKRRAKAA